MKEIFILLYIAGLTLAECPGGWSRRGDTPWCYKAFEEKTVSWNTAQQECTKYGADLVSYESKAEMEWVYNILNWNQNSGSWRYYWMGLNDLTQKGRLEWVSTHEGDEIAYSYNNFGVDADMHDASRRCTFSLFSNNLPLDYGHEGKWYKEKCEKTKGLNFVCKMNENWFIKTCPSSYWKVTMGYEDVCLKLAGQRRSFQEHENSCKLDGANLVHISNEEDQKAFNAWFGNKADEYFDNNPEYENDGFYIGLTDLNSDPRRPQMEWLYEWGSTPSYVNWKFGEPDATELNYPGQTCAHILDIDATRSNSPSWETERCKELKRAVCQKKANQACPEGWKFIPNQEGVQDGGKCVEFYLGGAAHLPWYEAKQFCESIGAQMLLIENGQEQKFMSQYFSEWERAGVTRMWQRISDISAFNPKPSDNCDWTNAQNGYDQWGGDEPKCRKESNSCGYFTTSASAENWATDYCSKPEAFSCQVRAGSMIHAIPKPINDHHCPERTDGTYGSDWVLNPNTTSCYLIGKKNIDNDNPLWIQFDTAQKYCREHQSELVSILDIAENSWLTNLALGATWIGMKLTQSGVAPSSWIDGNPLTFQNWRESTPYDNPEKMCVIMTVGDNYGTWENVKCDSENNRLPICKRMAMSGPISPPPDTPDVPPHVNCEAGWHFDIEKDSCLYLDSQDRAFDAAEANCLAMGGHLASINSPNEQAGIVFLMGLLPSASGFWIGGKDVHEEYFPNFGPGVIDGPGLLPDDNNLLPDRPGNGYLGGQWKWSNGKPWNYINWDNGQPKNEGSDDCVMIRSKDGLWEDFACTSRLKSICEKPPKTAVPGDDTIGACDDPSCCNGHIGVEFGGKVDDSSFSSSSEWKWNSRALAGRLNRPNRLLSANDINAINKETGGWIASADDKAPWWETNFKEKVNGISTEFLAEVKGIYTQGLSGYKGRPDWMLWTNQFTVAYQAPGSEDGEFTPIVDADGNTKVFNANWDKDTAVQNSFPYPILTKRIRIYPTKCSRDRCALRVEFIGCKTGCLKSLGVSQDAPTNGQGIINQVSDSQMTASSQLVGHEASKGRISYQGSYSLNDASVFANGKKTFQTYTKKSSWDSAQRSCGTQAGGAGVLGTIASSEDQNKLETAIRPISNGVECWWIGLRRTNGQYQWDDGTALEYTNWEESDNQNNACVCASPQFSYRWVTRDCETLHEYTCNRIETGHVWTAATADDKQWLQVDLGGIWKITAIFTQGAPEAQEWVTSFTMAYADSGRDDWHEYLNHDGNAAVVFTGNTDQYSINEGAILRQPITARFIKIYPKSWKGKISMRIDVLGCKTSERTDCLDDGSSFADYGNEFTVDCPAGCDLVEPQQVWGTGKYSLQSSVCQAAIHDGRMVGHNGGTVTFKTDVTAPSEKFEGSAQYGINSQELPSDENTKAMIFESDHIGCEAGWKGFRNSCYYIPKNANQNRKSWGDAQGICQKQNGWLATIGDEAEAQFLYSIIRDNNDLNHLWIGLKDEGHPNYYEKWSDVDETPVTFARWDRNRPKMVSGDQVQCVLAYRASFLWANNDCGRKTNYICERPKQKTNHIDTEDEGCKAGWQAYGNRCYKFVQQPKIYFWAQSYCHGLAPGDSYLATIYDGGINSWLNAKMQEWIQDGDHHNMWIGVYGQSDHGSIDYSWDSGEPIVYTNWEKGSPGVTLKCVFPFKMGLKEYNDCTEDGWPGQLLGAVANSKLWCSADYDFNANKRFIPCADGAFYQGCGMLSKSAHDGQWVTDYGSKVSPRPDPNQDEARGCYSAEYFVCEMMKDGTDGRPMPTEEPPLGPDCLGTGWSGYTTDGGDPSGKCYKVYSWHNEPTTNNSIGVDFGEAVEWCRAHNADLISLHSREQEQKVNDLIVKYEDSKSKYRDWYWLGFNDRGEKGYQWTDGSGDDYTNWAAGQPEKSLNLEDCSITVMRYDSDPIDEGWYSNYCNIQAGVVCAIRRGEEPVDSVPPPNVPTPDTQCQNADMSGEDLKWYSFDHRLDDIVTTKKCFALVNDRQMSVQSAEDFCRNLGPQGYPGSLISIHHHDDMYKLLQVAREIRDAEYWIGLRSVYDYDVFDYTYQWTDGSPTDYDNYAQGSPGDDWWDHDGTYMMATVGAWVTADSYDQRYFVCQFWPEGKPTPPPEETHTGGCPLDWFPYKNRCFKFVGFGYENMENPQMTWDDAEAYCEQTEGSTLATVYDQYYDSFVYAHMAAVAGDVFFGLRSDEFREWSFADNSSAYYTNWNAGEPNNANGNEYCAAKSRQHGKWNDISCSDIKPFVCSRDKSQEDTNTSPPNPMNCPAGYIPLKKACWKITSSAATQANAEAACQADRTGQFTSASLASITDIHDDYFLRAIMNEQGIDSSGTFEAWIGLYYDRNVDGGSTGDNDDTSNPNSVKWRWTDKNPVTYTSWGKNQPQPNSNAKGCVVIDGKGGWTVTDTCDAAKPYICKLHAAHNPEDHDDPGMDICLDEEIAYGGYCWTRRPGYYNFQDAEKTCAEFSGAKLASIHSDEERRFYASVDEWDGDSWIGLKRNENGGFEWIDDSPVDYTSWSDGEPNNGGSSGTAENCANTNGQGFWNDMSCEYGMAALCKRPASHEFCEVDGPDRKECGFPGIQAGECINYGCCWVPLDGHYWCFHPKNSAQCDSAGDPSWDNKCLDNSLVDERKCSRGADSSLCANTGVGGQDQTCCMHCSTAACKNEEAEWASRDTDCIMKGGGCQFTSISCKGGKTFHSEFTCGGPVDRQCCAPNVPPPPTPAPTDPIPPTIPTDSVPVDPNAGNGSGKTAGVVIGVMFAIVVVLGGGYYVKQNGIPFIADQQSFTNLNSESNTDGVTDGISNPLGGGADNDDTDDSGGNTAGDEEFKVEVIAPEPVAVAAPLPVEPVGVTPSGGAFDDFMTDSTPSASTGLDALGDFGSSAPPSGGNMTGINFEGGDMGDSLI